MTSAIDPTIPATGDSLASAPIRNNFAVAHDEITTLQSQVAALQAAISPPPFTLPAINYGTVFRYNAGPPGYPTQWILSDVWTTTWADDDNIYTVHDDSSGWQNGGPSANLAIALLSDYTPSVVGTIVNGMAPNFGANAQLGSDGASYKGLGIASVHGVLYLVVARQVYGNNSGLGTAAKQSSFNAQIIKSTNHGTTWTPLPPAQAQPYTTPMFPGSAFGAPYFIQYGKDYAGVGASASSKPDNSDTYLYAVSNDGWWNNGSNMYLGRVSLANLPNLNGADWTFYKGGDGMLDANWGAIASAVAIISNPLKVSMNGVQYLPAFNGYVMIQWWYPSIVNNLSFDFGTTQWDIYQAPHPWGPWTILSSKIWNSSPGKGLYNPNIIPKSLGSGGVTATIATAGDFSSVTNATADYTLTYVPITFGTPPAAPSNTVLPHVTGATTLGATLTTDNGTWTGSPTSYAYQWLRDGTAISGATASNRVIAAADQGHSLSCVVTATNSTGSTPATSNSVPVPAAAGAPSMSAPPSVTGATTLGATLTTTNGTWSNSPTSYTYQWQRDAANISGATASTYVIAAPDQGHNLACVVTATNASGSASATSNSVSVPAVTINITYVQSVSRTANSSGTSVTFPAFTAIGSGNTIVGILLFHHTSNNIASVVAGSNTLTTFDYQLYQAGAYSGITFALQGVTGNPTTITVTFSSTPLSTDHFIVFDEYASVSAIAQHSSGNAPGGGTTASLPLSITTTAVAQVWSAVMGVTASTPSGWTTRMSFASPYNAHSADLVQSTPGAVNVTWNFPSGNVFGAIVALAP